jgi:methyl-accepting chemotaxis protein
MDTAFDEAIAVNSASPALKDELLSLKKQGDAYLATAWNVQELAVAGNKAQAEAMLKEQEVPLWRDFRTKVLDLTKKNKQDFKQSATEVITTMRNSKYLILVLGVFGIALLLGTSGFVFRQVLGQLGGEPAEVARIAKEVAGGNLALDLNQGQGGIYGAMSVMAADLRRIIEMVSEGSQQVSSAATELDASARQSASLTQQALQQSHSVAVASEEMSATSADIARNCHMAADNSGRASQTARQGAEIIHTTMSNMENIAGNVRRSASVVEQLGARSDQIGAIVAAIEDIADQTNLLALNAAIEAARAGEQGRGFAVVADEVRALAERTTKATREIAEMIQSIQSETRSAVTIINESVKDVARGTAEAEQSGQAVAEILRQVEEATGQIGQIATAAEEQTATTGEITRNVQEISEVVSKNVVNTEEISSAASHLKQLSTNLHSLIAKFRLA